MIGTSAGRAGLSITVRVLAVSLLTLLLLASCSSIPVSKPEAPSVSIDSVRAIKLTLSGQELAFMLNVYNPNDFDLSLQNLSFVASLDDTEVARGMSNDRVTLPANDESRLEIRVSTQISKALGRLLLSNGKAETDIPYDVVGFVKLANWPVRIPFNVDGHVDNPGLD